MADPSSQDGRHARRERNRAAIIDAVFELVSEGKEPPRVEDVALRAGVSVSSVFRQFDGLTDLQHQALESFPPRFAHLLVVDDANSPRDDRIRSHVRMRVELYAAAGGLMRIGRARALDHELMVGGVSVIRGRLAEQTRRRFATELGRLTSARAADLVAVLDASTSPEAYDVMGAAHARTPRQITRAWIEALDALLTAWVPEQPPRQSNRKATNG